MKLLILLAAVAFSSADKLDKTYLPPNSQTSGGSGNILRTPLLDSTQLEGQTTFSSQNGNTYAQAGNQFSRNGNEYARNGNGFGPESSYNNVNGNNNYAKFERGPERAQASFERNAAILRQDNSNDGEAYAYAYETENGIYAEENGVATNGVEAQGGFTYTGDDGKVYSIRYTADQNGFVPQGDHLPTAPPVPEEILRALEQNARDEAAGIYDDGSYNAAKYGDEEATYNAQNEFNRNAYPTNDFKIDDEDTVVTNSASVPGIQFGNNIPLTGNNRVGNDATFGNVQKAYLPPFANQKAFAPSLRNPAISRRRQPSFNAQDGYKY